MNALELKVPPVVVVLLAALLMWVGRALAPGFNFDFPFQQIIGWVFALAGLTVSFLGWLAFNRAKTTVNPMKPETSSALVASGIYRYTRNPMYLGFLLVLTACAIWSASLFAFVMLPVFVLYMNRFQVGPEERALARIFGDEFEVYRGEVRRWI